MIFCTLGVGTSMSTPILFPDFPISLIKIADTRKSYLENEAYHFSISHCSDYAAAIVSSRKRVGVDIEVPTPKVQKIMHKFLHQEEQQMFNSELAGKEQTANEKSVEKLTLLWNAKEAVFKWWSYGNVDFSEMIRLQPFTLQPEGIIEGAFVSDRVLPLQLHYKIFDLVSLAWIANDLRQ